MLRAVLSDIHSNVEALDAVMSDAEKRGAAQFICLGDVIGYGPEPRITLRRAFSYETTILGNHEEACMYYAEDFNERARVALDWTREQLNSAAHPPEENAQLWDFIGRMPTEQRLDNGFLVHGSPRDPVREYMLPRDIQNVQKMSEIFAMMPEGFTFVGHSHVPGVYTATPQFAAPARFPEGFRLPSGQKVLVNVGSVGQPRDGDARASYATWDGDRIWFHRVEYDYRATQRKILETGVLPRYLAQRLEEGR